MIKSYTGNINVKSNWILDFTLSKGVPLTVTLNLGMVPKGGLEPPRVASHAPQTCASASSATSA